MEYERKTSDEELEQQIVAEKISNRKKKFRRFFKGLALSWIISLVVLSLIAKFYLAPLLKTKIEEKGSALLGAPFTISSVSFRFFPTLGVSLNTPGFDIPAWNLSGTSSSVKVDLGASIYELVRGRPLGIISIDMDQPRIEISSSKIAIDDSASQASSEPLILPQIHSERNFGVRFSIRNGWFHQRFSEGSEITSDHTSVVVKLPQINNYTGELAVSSDSDLNVDGTHFVFPATANAKIKLDGNDLTVAEGEGKVLGLVYSANGMQNLLRGTGSWKLSVFIKELASLATPPPFLPAGKWSGRLNGVIEASCLSKTAGWKTHSRWDMTQVKGLTHFEKGLFAADGQLTASGSAEVITEPGENQASILKFDHTYLAADLTNMSLLKEKEFKKPKGVPLVFYISGAGTKDVANVEKFDVKFANLVAHGLGSLGLKANSSSSLSIAIEKTKLDGWEEYLPILFSSEIASQKSGNPVTKLKGTVQLNADFKGNWSVPSSRTFHFYPLLIEDLEVPVATRSELRNLKLDGSIKSNLRAELNIVGAEARGVNVSGDFDFTGLDVHPLEANKPTSGLLDGLIGREFIKKVGEVTALNFTLSQKSREVTIQSALGRIGHNAVNITGRFTNMTRPEFEISLLSQSVNLVDISNFFPRFASWQTNGSASVNAIVAGVYDWDLGFGAGPLRFRAMGAASIRPAGFNLLEQILSKALEAGFTRRAQQINTIVKSLPPKLAPRTPASAGGVGTLVTTDYLIQNSRVNFSRTTLLSNARDEFRGQGSIGFDSSLTATGTAYIASLAPAANRKAKTDPQGRLLVPLKIQGTLAKPEIAFSY